MFKVKRPTYLAELAELLQVHGGQAVILAGGTDLMVRLKASHNLPQVVIDLKQIRELSADIVETSTSLRIGALTIMAQLEESSLIQTYFPALAEAAHIVGSVQIRNRATLAGNICNASPAADTVPPLLIYDARIHLYGSHGRRIVPIEQFFVGFKTVDLLPGEIVTAVELPYPLADSGSAFERLTRRRGVDLATVSVACLVQEGRGVRFGLGAVAPTPLLVVDDRGTLSTPGMTQEEIDAALTDLANQASPISDVRAGQRYREAMLLVLMRRAMARAKGYSAQES